ncbi:MAG: glycosyltransferase family 4 protein [Bacteroidota bacterium]
MLPRVLLVTYYFPPAGGPGVQRMLKTVRYLRESGFEPVVLTVEDPAAPSLDASLLADVPAGVRIVRTKAPDPFALYGRLTGQGGKAVPTGAVDDAGLLKRLAMWIRANVFLPDARVGWVPFAVRAGRRILGDAQREFQPFAAVVTSGPPHSVHLTGLRLRTSGIPWLADFRDPWTSINFYDDLPMTAPARALDRRLERRVLQTADSVTTVSPTWARLLERQGGLPAGAVHIVHNGVDESDLAAAEGVAVTSDAFTLVHVGSLYATRNPTALWEALRRLRQQGTIDRLVVRLVGRVDEVVRQSAESAGVAVEMEPYVPHDEAVRQQASAGLLLLSIEPFAADAGMITGKLYEYLASGRPVLGVGPPEGDAAALLRETAGGVLLGREDVTGIMEVVRDHYAAWAEGAPRSGASWDAVLPYTRRAQTARLAEILCTFP